VSVQRPTIVNHYHHRATSFYKAALDLDVLDAPTNGPAIGLLAVHSCIALADALLVALEGTRTASENHAEAARRLHAWCAAKGLVESGIKHFEWRLGRKTHFSYDERIVREEELQLAKVKMDQFLLWGLRTFPAVLGIKESTDA
jgi:hypothetical protein